MSFVNEDGLAKLRPLAHDFAEDDGLFEEKDLQLLELFGRHFAQLRAAVKLTVQQQFALGGYLALLGRVVVGTTAAAVEKTDVRHGEKKKQKTKENTRGERHKSKRDE